MNIANMYLHQIPRVTCIGDAAKYSGDVLYYPKDAEFEYVDNLIQTHGLGTHDKKRLDLIRVVCIEDALNLNFKKTNILTPLIFAENCCYIPWHITTQCILLTTITLPVINWVKEDRYSNRYQKHEFDRFWLPFSKSIHEIRPGEKICIFNRRVAGWDGSHKRPVIELLGAGGHLPTLWDDTLNCFRELSFKENIRKEFSEELGEKIRTSISVFGGYVNEVTHELVVLCGAEVQSESLVSIQEYAIKNIDFDTEGIYLGTFKETIEFYRNNPSPFAGGVNAAPYNFPNREELMKRVLQHFNI